MTRLHFGKLAIAATFALAIALPGQAEASVTFGFTNITNNNPTDAAIGEAQLSMTVTDLGGGQVEFRFDNAGPEASSITDIYFDDGLPPLLTSITSITNGTGVDFSVGATPGNLPGGNLLSDPFVASSAFLTSDSNPPRQPNGVNPGEFVALAVGLQSGVSYSDVITALNSADLRVGIHVQGFKSGGSESFVNHGGDTPPPPVVPEPGSIALLGMGIAGFVAQRRRQRNRS